MSWVYTFWDTVYIKHRVSFYALVQTILLMLADARHYAKSSGSEILM